jgi:hypothetical protein
LVLAGVDLCTGAFDPLELVDDPASFDEDELPDSLVPDLLVELADFDESDPESVDEPLPESFEATDSLEPFVAGAAAPTPAAALSLLSVR